MGNEVNQYWKVEKYDLFKSAFSLAESMIMKTVHHYSSEPLTRALSIVKMTKEGNSSLNKLPFMNPFSIFHSSF